MDIAPDAPKRPAFVQKRLMCYNINCRSEQNPGRFAFLNAVIQHNNYIVGKTPLISGHTSRCSLRQRRQTDKGRFVMFTKKCNTCGKEKQISEYHRNPKTRDGYYTSCKDCCAEYQREYRRKNKDKIRIDKKRYREENREKVLARKRKYAAENRERESARAIQWQKDNRDKVIIRSKLRRIRERSNGGELDAIEWQQIKKSFDFRCAACGKRKPLEPDHIIPVAKGGPGNAENIQPLCRSCNASKGTKIIDYRRQHYKQGRLL